MAKSKLSLQLSQALVNVEATLGEFKQTMEKDKHITPEQTKRLERQSQELQHASSAMKEHLAKLKDRESSPKVADRLRNLKNVFKNKEELKQQRDAMRQWYAGLEARIAKRFDKSNKLLYGEDAAETAKRLQDIREHIAEIQRMKIEIHNFDNKVDALDTALAQ